MRKIMRYSFLTVLFLLTGLLISTGYFASGQKPPVTNRLSRAGLLQDMSFLNQAVKMGHPVNYKAQVVQLDPLIDSLARSGTDSLTRGEYRFILGKALYLIGCVHTQVESNPVPGVKSNTYFPLQVSFIGEHLYYTGTTSDSLKGGTEIIEVNALPVSTILNSIQYYAASDGATPAFSDEYLGSMAGQLIGLYLTYPKQYTIKFANKAVLILPGDTSKPVTGKATAPIKSDMMLKAISPSTMLVKLTSFNSNQDYETVFQKINTGHIKNLILDLRGNTGGDRDAVVALASHMNCDTFNYQILQPKRLHPYSYLNGKGKIYYLLSLLKYNVGNFY